MSRGWYWGSTMLSITDDVSLISQLISKPQCLDTGCSWLLPLGSLKPLVSLPLGHHPSFPDLARILWIELGVLPVLYSSNPNGNHLCLTLSELFASCSCLSALFLKHSWLPHAFLSLCDSLSRTAWRQLCGKTHLCFDVGYIHIATLFCFWCEIKKEE